MCEDEQKLYEGLKYGVELFKYHADQRLRCIRYYTVIFLASIAGIVGLERFLCNREFPPDISLIIILFVSCIIAAITLFFWLLDIRNRVLTEYAEKGLKKLENYLFCDSNKRDLKIVNNCEDQKPAWHYGIIVPCFFFFVISINILTSLSMLMYNSCISLCSIINLPFILFLFLLLYLGVYSEGKFLESNPNKNKRKEETGAVRFRRFLFNSAKKWNFFTLLLVLVVCLLLIIFALLILRYCPP